MQIHWNIFSINLLINGSHDIVKDKKFIYLYFKNQFFQQVKTSDTKIWFNLIWYFWYTKTWYTKKNETNYIINFLRVTIYKLRRIYLNNFLYYYLYKRTLRVLNHLLNRFTLRKIVKSDFYIWNLFLLFFNSS